MKKLFTLFIFLPFYFKAQSNLIASDFQFQNPGNLNCFYYAPSQLKNTESKFPLIIVLHGCGQCAETAAEQSDWNKLADNLGCFVLYPQQRSFNNPTKCFRWFRKKSTTKYEGEL